VTNQPYRYSIDNPRTDDDPDAGTGGEHLPGDAADAGHPYDHFSEEPSRQHWTNEQVMRGGGRGRGPNDDEDEHDEEPLVVGYDVRHPGEGAHGEHEPDDEYGEEGYGEEYGEEDDGHYY